MSTQVNHKQFFSKSEACDALGISLPGLNRQLKAGKIPSIKLGSRVLIPVSYLTKLEADALASIEGGR